MSVSLKADIGGSVGSIQLNGADRLLLNADGTLSGTSNPATGLRSSALATMQKFADEFGFLLSPTGYQKLPSGFIVQWGLNAYVPPAGVVTPLPITFPTAILWAGATYRQIKGGAMNYVGVDSNKLSSIDLTSTLSTGAQVYWMAFGK